MLELHGINRGFGARGVLMRRRGLAAVSRANPGEAGRIRRLASVEGAIDVSERDYGDDSTITSVRLELRTIPPAFYQALLAGDLGTAANEIRAEVPASWPPEIGELAQLWLGRLQDEPERGPWLTRAIVRRSDNTVIGHVGFHDRPGAPYLDAYSPGAVEIGCTILEEYRQQRYATEAAGALMDWAHDRQGVSRFVATVSPENLASLALIRQFGFEQIGSHVDDVDGREDIFERTWR